MAERLVALADSELERALADLGRDLAYPPTPELAGAVRQRLTAQARGGPIRARWLPAPRRLALALAALLVLAGVLLALSPAARTAVADRLGLRGVSIEHLPSFGSPPVAIPMAQPVGGSLNLGERATVAEAQARVAYQVLVPSLPELGSPDEVYLNPLIAGGQVALVYRARPGLPPATETGVGLLLTQFRAPAGSLDRGILGKGVGPDTRVEEVTVNGGRGIWIEGRPHALFIRDANGRFREETVRLAGNVLLWEQGPLTLRLEANVSREQALRIAQSAR